LVVAPAFKLCRRQEPFYMEVLHSHCCGLDVHKKSISGCIITPDGKEIRTFFTMTWNLVELVDWIKSKDCTYVAMESTGDFLKPIYNQPLVVNA
jgi:transposase